MTRRQSFLNELGYGGSRGDRNRGWIAIFAHSPDSTDKPRKVSQSGPNQGLSRTTLTSQSPSMAKLLLRLRLVKNKTNTNNKNHDLQKKVSDWTCRWFYVDFIWWLKKIYIDTISNSRFTISNSFHELITALCAVFPALHFDVTRMSSTSRIGSPQIFADRSRKKWMDCNIFVSYYYCLCGVNFWWRIAAI